MTATATPREAPSETPRVRTSIRRRLFWIVVVVAALAAAVLTVVLGSTATGDSERYSAENAGPDGSRALAEVLRQQGVEVVPVGTLAEAREAVAAAGGSATVLFTDPGGYLGDDGLEEVAAFAELGAQLVLVEPGYTELDAIAPGIAPAGAAEEKASTDPECALPAAERAGAISQPWSTYRFTGDDAGTASGALACYPSYDDAYALLVQPAGEGTVTVLGAGDALVNGTITQQGDAALALGLLGSQPTVVWYIPTFEDASGGAAPTLGSLTPGWVTPVILLLMLVVLAAGIWRGRRFGPVVVENLPVTVRASETMEGRARLYAKQGAHARALDSLRVGTIARLTVMLALPRHASVVEVSRAVAAVTGRNVDEVHGILLGAMPGSEAELLRLSDALLLLEQQVRAASTPR